MYSLPTISFEQAKQERSNIEAKISSGKFNSIETTPKIIGMVKENPNYKWDVLERIDLDYAEDYSNGQYYVRMKGDRQWYLTNQVQITVHYPDDLDIPF